jgi:glycosyltransferase involved in cell wall biosynthesis
MPRDVANTLKVLLATAYFDSHRGGIEIVAGRLARELQRRGADVTWLATDATPPSASADSGKVLPVAAWNVAERRLGFPLPLPGVGGVAAIWRAVKATDCVLLHDSLYPTNVVALLAARWHRRPVVLVQHIAAVPYSNPVLRLVMRAANAVIARPMLSAADQVVFISDTVAQHFAAVRFKSPPRLIFNGVDTDVFQLPAAGFDQRAARSKLGLPTDGTIVSFVGRFVEKKGLHIIERLARTRPDLTFALAGWGPIDPQSWGLPNVHVFSGLQGASLAPFYQVSDVFVLPSIGEGLPLVLQEALACGVPVICGDETAAADPAAHGIIDGVPIIATAPDSTAAAFATRIDALLSRNSEAAAAQRHAYVQSRYSWSEAAKSYAAIMSDLVGAQSRS